MRISDHLSRGCVCGRVLWCSQSVIFHFCFGCVYLWLKGEVFFQQHSSSASFCCHLLFLRGSCFFCASNTSQTALSRFGDVLMAVLTFFGMETWVSYIRVEFADNFMPVQESIRILLSLTQEKPCKNSPRALFTLHTLDPERFDVNLWFNITTVTTQGSMAAERAQLTANDKNKHVGKQMPGTFWQYTAAALFFRVCLHILTIRSVSRNIHCLSAPQSTEEGNRERKKERTREQSC